MFLTNAELLALTGRARPKAQIKFLKAKHIRHVVNKAGRVVVMREWLAERGHTEAPGPNFGALRLMKA